MSTNRNAKGQFARKTTRPLADKETLPTTVHGLLYTVVAQLDQIQRDIEQVRTLAHQTRTNSRANTVIINKTLAGVDLLKSRSSFMQEIEGHKDGHDTDVATMPAPPEEPKAEPWVPKVNEWACSKSGYFHGAAKVTQLRYVNDRSSPPCAELDNGKCDYWTNLRPATTEEIAQAEREEKLKKLVRGCRVRTPDGEGIYLGRDVAAEGHHPYWVSLNCDPVPGAPDCYNLDQITPLP